MNVEYSEIPGFLNSPFKILFDMMQLLYFTWADQRVPVTITTKLYGTL